MQPRVQDVVGLSKHLSRLSLAAGPKVIFRFDDGQRLGCADAKLLHRIMSPVGMADPEVVSAAIAYLGSDDATHVNGAELRVDGGTHS